MSRNLDEKKVSRAFRERRRENENDEHFGVDPGLLRVRRTLLDLPNVQELDLLLLRDVGERADVTGVEADLVRSSNLQR